jgi:hypothetical protein
MKKIINTGFVILTKGILLVLLGIVHIMAIFIWDLFFEHDKAKDLMPVQLSHEFTLWFAVGGIFFIFMGIIDIISYKGIKNRMNWAWKTSFTCAVFCIFCGILGIAVFKEGPPFLILFLGLSEIIPLMLYKSEFNY